MGDIPFHLRSSSRPSAERTADISRAQWSNMRLQFLYGQKYSKEMKVCFGFFLYSKVQYKN